MTAFQSRYRTSAELIDKWDRDSVASLVHVSDGNHFTISEDFVEEGIPYYRGQDVTGRFFAPRIQALLDILGRDGLTLSDVAAPTRPSPRRMSLAFLRCIA